MGQTRALNFWLGFLLLLLLPPSLGLRGSESPLFISLSLPSSCFSFVRSAGIGKYFSTMTSRSPHLKGCLLVGKKRRNKLLVLRLCLRLVFRREKRRGEEGAKLVLCLSAKRGDNARIFFTKSSNGTQTGTVASTPLRRRNAQ